MITGGINQVENFFKKRLTLFPKLQPKYTKDSQNFISANMITDIAKKYEYPNFSYNSADSSFSGETTSLLDKLTPRIYSSISRAKEGEDQFYNGLMATFTRNFKNQNRLTGYATIGIFEHYKNINKVPGFITFKKSSAAYLDEVTNSCMNTIIKKSSLPDDPDETGKILSTIASKHIDTSEQKDSGRPEVLDVFLKNLKKSNEEKMLENLGYPKGTEMKEVNPFELLRKVIEKKSGGE